VSTAPVTLAAVAWSTLGVVAFVALLFVGSLLLPGAEQPGAARSDGTRILYRCNGLALFVLALLTVAGVELVGPGLAPLAQNAWSLLIAANLLAFPACAVLFLTGRSTGRKSARDFFYGVERDPQLLGIDLKMFSYRPSLIGLALMNLSFASLQHAATGTVSLAMLLYQVFTLLYVANYFQFEHGMVFTWDIVEERFGWMLVWGDYVLVPFFYSLPTAYVLSRERPLPPLAAVALVLLYALGFWVFRGANGQKHRFKQNAATARIWGRPAATLGGSLLVSGFWGIGRKLNYSGELTMYVAWTMLAGCASPVPYLLPAWLAVLLTHRALRDDRRCRAKCGTLWEEYCRRARFRMFPYL